jgi:NAD(P)-dependent dehydrogenase (short-subunit alcohol dehydrogenase family)
MSKEELMNGEDRESFLKKFRVDGKVALVTGGSRGIGRSIALGLAEAGADVALASRKLPDLEAVAEEIEGMGRKALAVAANVRHLPEVDTLVERTVAEFGRVDILVNNAGTNVAFDSVFNMDEKIWDVIMGLNLKTSYFLSQAVGKIMREKGGGSIINIASEEGMRPGVGRSIYAISKAGVIMLTKALAQEWGQYNIRANAIAPGVVKTRLSTALWSDPVIRGNTEDDTALGRIAEPEEMVGAALFLASEASSYMTGETLTLNGGLFASVRTLLSTIPPKQ